jgi:hypothetical protein
MVLEPIEYKSSETLLESLQNNWRYIKTFFSISGEEQEQQQLDPNVYNVVKNTIIPKTCDRCYKYPPKIRLFDKRTGVIEFICYRCKKGDKILSDLEVKID